MTRKNMFEGISVSPLIVIGNAYVHFQQEITVSDDKISDDRVESEIERFVNGREKAKNELEAIYIKALKNLGADKAEIFEGHIEILMDDEMEDEISDLIHDKHMTAEAAVSDFIERNARDFEEMDNKYMAERAADVRDIGKRLVYGIAGVSIKALDQFDREVIIFAHDLTPSDTAQMDRSKVKGFVTEIGGITSHVAIMARALELPAIVGAGTILDSIQDNDQVIIDGISGKVLINPDDKTIKEYQKKMKQGEEDQRELMKLKDLPAETTDGHRVELCANIGTDREVETALKYGAEGVGLFRTEFLYMDKPQMPTEEEQFQAYKAAAEGMAGKAVIIRTMDIGGDKELSYLQCPPEQNPFLGWRAIRICLDKKEILICQLRAILRASSFGKLRIMYPMIISVSEIRQLNEVLKSVKEDLRKNSIPFDEKIEVGIMVETPAAAVIAADLIKEVDFFSIGTNDLTQYTLAVDRGNEKIASLYQPLHPAVTRLIKTVIDASHQAGKWTGMCGELAGDERATILLAGMGLDEFSMSPSSIVRIKNIIRKSSFAEMKKVAAQALSLSDSSEVISILDSALRKIMQA
jgi:phosphoenolpyruvate-protein phosphotransferase (PTS system enzyme I)